MGSDQSRRAVAGSDDRPGYPARGVDRNAASEVPAPAHGRRQSSDRRADQALAPLSTSSAAFRLFEPRGLGSKPARGCGIERTAWIPCASGPTAAARGRPRVRRPGGRGCRCRLQPRRALASFTLTGRLPPLRPPLVRAKAPRPALSAPA